MYASCRASREAASLARALAARGSEYERALDVRAAVQCFEEACRLVPDSTAYLSLAAKSWSDLTFYYDVKTDRERQLVNLKAVEYAEKASGCSGGRQHRKHRSGGPHLPALQWCKGLLAAPPAGSGTLLASQPAAS